MDWLLLLLGDPCCRSYRLSHSAADCAHYGSCALQTDVYALPAGARGQLTLEPAFTYHGFRFVQVEGIPAGVAVREFGAWDAFAEEVLHGLAAARGQ